MKRRINWKFFGLLIVSVLVGAGTVHGIHLLQVRNVSRSLLTQAKEAETAGDLLKAEQAYLQFLGYEPGSAEALNSYAMILARETNVATPQLRGRAIQALERAVTRDPTNHPEARRRLAELLIADTRSQDARGHIEILLTNSPTDATLLEIRGRCYEEDRQLPKAIDDYKAAKKIDPTRIDVYQRLAYAYRKSVPPNVGEADKVMDAKATSEGLIHNNPSSSKAFLTRSRYRRAFKLAGIEEDVAESLKLAPDDAEAIGAAAEIARESDDRVAERMHLDRGIKLFPKNPDFYRSLASLEIREGKLDAAINILKKAADEMPADIFIRWNLSEVFVQADRLDEASDQVKKLRELGFLRELGDSIEAHILYRQHKWSQAAKALNDVAPLILTRPGLSDQAKTIYILLAQCHEHLGNLDQQLDAYRKAVAINSANTALNTQARTGLAASFVALNRGDQAIDEFEKLSRTPGSSPGIYVGMIQQMIAKNRRLPSEQRDWRAITEMIDKVEQANPNQVEAKIIRVELLIARDQIEAARELLEKTRDQFPETPSIWIALAILANRQGRIAEVPIILDQATKKIGDVADLRVAKLRYWASVAGAEGKAAIDELSRGLEKFPDDVRHRIMASVGVSYAQVGESKAAAKIWSDLAQQEPDNLEPKLVLFDLAAREGDEAVMRRQIDELHKVEGDEGSYWRYGEARLFYREAEALLNKKKNKPAALAIITKGRKLLTETIERRPNWSRAVLALAEFDDLEGLTQNALTSYLKAIDLGERDERAIVRSVQMLNRSRRYAEADKLLRKLQQERPLLGSLGKLAADTSVLTQDFGRALDLAEKTVLTGSTDPRDHLWLGQLRAANGERATQAGRLAEATKLYTQAEQSFRRAIELAPTDPAMRIVFVRFLALTKQTSAMETALAECDKVLTKGRAALVRAQAFELAGQTENAIGNYREALAETPDDVLALRGLAEIQLKRGNSKEAEETLRTMAALGPKAPEESALGRRVLAMLLASSGDHRKSVQALQLLGNEDPALGGAAMTIDDRRAKARILARQPNRPQRKEAIRLLEAVNVLQVPQAEDQFLLAQLYEADGDWTAAKTIYQALLQADPKNGTVILSYSRSLIRRKDFDEAKLWMKRLEESAPRTPQLLEVTARLLAAQNRGAEAASLARSIIEIQPNQTPAVAILLEEIGEVSAAEVIFRQIAADPALPTNPLYLAEFLGRQGRAAEALDICEKAWATCPPEFVATDSVLILYNSPADEALCKRVITRIEEAIQAHPDDVSFQFALANVYVLQYRYDEAEAIYRQTAETAKDNASSLNNLAWLLAIQNTKASEALKVANDAIAIAGPRPQILDTRALAYMLLGRADLAIKDLEDAVAVEPTAEIYVHLARARWMADRRDDAEKAMKEADNLGLRTEKIHPLEREAYKKLLGEIANRKGKS